MKAENGWLQSPEIPPRDGGEREESFSRGGIHLPRLNPFHPFSLLVFLLFGGLINQTLVDHASFRKVFEILDSHFPPTPPFWRINPAVQRFHGRSFNPSNAENWLPPLPQIRKRGAASCRPILQVSSWRRANLSVVELASSRGFPFSLPHRDGNQPVNI